MGRRELGGRRETRGSTEAAATCFYSRRPHHYVLFKKLTAGPEVVTLLSLIDVTALMISDILLQRLKSVEPNATFTGSMPRVSSSSGKVYFVKTGAAREKDQFTGEAESLEAMGSLAPGLVPKVLDAGQFEDGKPYFISEYKDFGSLGGKTAEVLAKRLATEMHRPTDQKKFGFGVRRLLCRVRFCRPKEAWLTGSVGSNALWGSVQLVRHLAGVL